MRKASVVILFTLFITMDSHAQFDPFDPESIAEGAPKQLMHFGQLVGKWDIVQESLDSSGSAWEAGGTARWDFYWIMNGFAIQDDWKPQASSSTGQSFGTNVRTYNAETDTWNIAWLVSGGSPVLEITAKSTSEEVVMSVNVKNPQGFYRRITFFEMEKDSFEWKQEWSNDGENAWFTVAKIHGKRINQ